MGTSRRNGQTAGGKVWLLRSLIVILGLNTTAQSENTEWPMWRGSNQDGKFAQNDVFPSQQRYGLRVTWRKKLGSGYSSVSVAEGRAFTMFSDDKSDYLIALAARGRSTFSELRWYPPMEAAKGSLSWVFRAKQPESVRTGP